MAHRIDHVTAAPGGLFTEGNPATGTPATRVTDDWLNDTVQEEICGVIEADGITLDKANNKQLLQAINRLGRKDAGLRNQLTDGDFKLWFAQSALVSVFTGYPDGPAAWRYFTGQSSGTATLSRQLHAFGQTEVPGTPSFYLRIIQSVAGTGSAPQLSQRLENLLLGGGQKGTITVYLRAPGANLAVKPRIQQHYGPADSVNTDGPVWTVAAGVTWQKFTHTFDIPSNFGHSVAANAYFEVTLILPVASTFQIEVSDIDFSLGAVSIPFERRSTAVDALLLARGVQSSYSFDTAKKTAGLVGVVQADEGVGAVVQGMQRMFRVPMRAIPTIVWYSPNGGASSNDKVAVGGFDVDVTAVSGVSHNSTGSPTVGSSLLTKVEGHFFADARL